MIKVHLWASLQRLADGKEVVEVEANTIGQMLDALVKAYPAMEPIISAGVSVAVDGEIIAAGRHMPVSAENEIFLLQQMKGG